MISDTLKQTLENNNKFLTLSLVITLQKKCFDEFLRLGISPESLSFITVAMAIIAAEVAVGHDYIKTNEDFNKIIKDIK
jgi:hypothetical protein